jgi:L-asparaginase
MKVDKRLAAAIPAMSSKEILSMVTNIDKFADIETITFGKFPGPHMTPDRIMELNRLVKSLIDRDDIDGVVITHGTDTLEETAFFLDLSLPDHKPIVMVAAMRNGSELGYDGPSNLSAAICTAISDQARHKGVLLVMNNEINSAQEVTKTHTMSLDTFKSMEFGPLGIVDNDEAIFYRNIVRHPHIETDYCVKDVYLIKAAVGSDSCMIDFCVERGAKGIIIEGMGRGNLPPEMVPGIERALAKEVRIVMVSRCPMGRVYDSYGYEGGGKMLRNAGVIFGGNLNGQKARIKLMLALTVYKDYPSIKNFFEKDLYSI